MGVRTLVFLMCALFTRNAMSIIAYDCVHDRSNITSISLLGVKACIFDDAPTEEVKIDIQLVQLKEVGMTHVFQCMVKVQKLVTRCSTWEDAQVVQGGFSSYVDEISTEECRKAHETKTYDFSGDVIIKGLKRNSSITTTTVLAGYLSTEGDCKGVTYRHGTYTWDHVVVQAVLEISLSDYYASVSLQSDEIHLRSGIKCSFEKGSCNDYMNGFSTWDVNPPGTCSPTRYDVLYEGPSIRSRSRTEHNQVMTTYTVKSDEILFALSTTTPTPICMLQGYQTEHPKLFIIEKTTSHFYFQRTELSTSNLDFFIYFNTKFVYVEKHFKHQLTSLHRTYRRERCEMERKILMTQIGTARSNPSDFAYTFMGGPGYSASVAGEIIRLIKCQAVNVDARETPLCYDELPVTYNNRSLFMTPKTRLLVTYGKQTDCSIILGPMYFMYGKWYSPYPKLHEVTGPHELEPSSKSTWEYQDAGELAKSGLYSQSDIDSLRKQLMFPSERDAIDNIITRGVVSSNVDLQNIRMINLIPENELTERIKSIWARTWSAFTTFGQFSAGIFGIILCWKIIKFMFDTIIHGLELKKSYSSNWVLLASFWDSLTNYLLFRKLHSQSRNPQANAPEPDVELGGCEMPHVPKYIRTVERTNTLPVRDPPRFNDGIQ